MTERLLREPETTVIGATDPYAMAVFMAVYGGETRQGPRLSRAAAKALYGLDEELEQLIVTFPEAPGQVRIVKTPNAAPKFEPLVAGPYGIDFYSKDLNLSLELSKRAGASGFTDVVHYRSEGPVSNKQHPERHQVEARFLAPDEMSVYVTDVNISASQYPTVLMTNPSKVHSELLMLCWVVEEVEPIRKFWTDAGLDVVVDVFAGADQMQVLMNHPRSTPLGCLNVADPKRTRRMEFMWYPEEKVKTKPTWPLQAGLHAGGFYVDDVEATIARLPDAKFGPVVEADEGRGPRKAAAGLAPGGVRLELWQR